jgi:hypothetical protein
MYGSESSYGTKNMLRHIPKCPRRYHKDIEKMHERQEQKMFTRKIKQDEYREKVAKAIIKHNYSFISMEHEGNSFCLFVLNFSCDVSLERN